VQNPNLIPSELYYSCGSNIVEWSTEEKRALENKMTCYLEISNNSLNIIEEAENKFEKITFARVCPKERF